MVRFRVSVRVRVRVRVRFAFASILECTGIRHLHLARAAPSYSGHESSTLGDVNHILLTCRFVLACLVQVSRASSARSRSTNARRGLVGTAPRASICAEASTAASVLRATRVRRAQSMWTSVPAIRV